MDTPNPLNEVTNFEIFQVSLSDFPVSADSDSPGCQDPTGPQNPAVLETAAEVPAKPTTALVTETAGTPTAASDPAPTIVPVPGSMPNPAADPSALVGPEVPVAAPLPTPVPLRSPAPAPTAAPVPVATPIPVPPRAFNGNWSSTKEFYGPGAAVNKAVATLSVTPAGYTLRTRTVTNPGGFKAQFEVVTLEEGTITNTSDLVTWAPSRVDNGDGKGWVAPGSGPRTISWVLSGTTLNLDGVIWLKQ